MPPPISMTWVLWGQQLLLPNPAWIYYRADRPEFLELREGNFTSVRKKPWAFSAVNETTTLKFLQICWIRKLSSKQNRKWACKCTTDLVINCILLQCSVCQCFSASSCSNINCKCQWTALKDWALKRSVLNLSLEPNKEWITHVFTDSPSLKHHIFQASVRIPIRTLFYTESSVKGVQFRVQEPVQAGGSSLTSTLTVQLMRFSLFSSCMMVL